VTGVSLPKIQKPRDYVKEMSYVNQPPPTPVETSIVTFDNHTTPDGRFIHQIEEHTVEEDVQHVPAEEKEQTPQENVDNSNSTPDKEKESQTY
jgi:hypothetical protein